MAQTIALVDDDRNILTSISIALEKEGFKVTYLDVNEDGIIKLSDLENSLTIYFKWINNIMFNKFKIFK